MRLLLVEDDTHLRERLAAHFRGAGWVVDEAADGSEAGFMIAEYSCDVAIVDLGLPDVTGMTLIEQWRAGTLDQVEATEDAKVRFNQYLKDGMGKTVWVGGCQSWYLTADGKQTVNWPGFTFTYRYMTRKPTWSDYVQVR